MTGRTLSDAEMAALGPERRRCLEVKCPLCGAPPRVPCKFAGTGSARKMRRLQSNRDRQQVAHGAGGRSRPEREDRFDLFERD